MESNVRCLAFDGLSTVNLGMPEGQRRSCSTPSTFHAFVVRLRERARFDTAVSLEKEVDCPENLVGVPPAEQSIVTTRDVGEAWLDVCQAAVLGGRS